MLNTIISGTEITVSAFLICTAVSLVLGLGIALLCMYKSKYSQSFILTLAMLPAVVQIVIMMVNGNIGAGLAVAGTFALVRFRSAPGTAKEITGIFFTVAIGLACGMGYVGYAAVFFVIVALCALLLKKLQFGEPAGSHRQLKIMIPENLDYEGLFDDLFEKYTRSHELMRVRTTNMGTLYELVYTIELRDPNKTKEFIDAIRCRNGNLNIICGREAEREVM